MGSHLMYLYSSRATQINRLAVFLPNPIRRYSKAGGKGSSGHHHGGVEDKAPSTAEEFERVAEEKARQGVASQTVEKAEEAFEEAIAGHSNFQTVKERYKEPVGKGDFHKPGHE